MKLSNYTNYATLTNDADKMKNESDSIRKEVTLNSQTLLKVLHNMKNDQNTLKNLV